jgi:hypothetical protein
MAATRWWHAYRRQPGSASSPSLAIADHANT